jgi:hypothetical protein
MRTAETRRPADRATPRPDAPPPGRPPAARPPAGRYRGAMPAPRRLGQFRRPRWRDPAFWAAVGITLALFAVQVALVPDRSGPLAWAALALRLAVTWLVISATIRVRVGLVRGMRRGAREAYAAQAGRPEPTAAERTAQATGRIAGRLAARRAARGDERN